MFSEYLERLKKILFLPEFVERHSVAKARNKIQKAVNGIDDAESTVWVDISVISRRDPGTGIQRVVRALISEFQIAKIPGWSVQPVAATPRQPYRAVSWNIPIVDLEKYPVIQPQAGDIFLGLDLAAHIIPRHQSELAAWKDSGVRMVFVVYDLLPLHYPQWFSAKLVRAFRRWIKSVAILADQVFCISQPVKQDFEHHILTRFGIKTGEIAVHIFPMGSDIKASLPSKGLPLEFSDVLSGIQHGNTALMVGTIEPRKGYEQILKAFETLWRNGKKYNLVIVGRPGWMTHQLQTRITASPLLNIRLFWFDNASDEALELLYQHCTGVIIASYAEGYGLPLLEAIEHGKPVLARNLPVFRQFETPLISYFPTVISAEAVSIEIDQWLEANRGRVTTDLPISKIELPTWKASLNGLLESLLAFRVGATQVKESI